MKSNDAIPRLSDFNKRPSEQFPTLGIHFDPDDDHRAAEGSGGVSEQHHRRRRRGVGGMGGFQKKGKDLGAREAIKE